MLKLLENRCIAIWCDGCERNIYHITFKGTPDDLEYQYTYRDFKVYCDSCIERRDEDLEYIKKSLQKEVDRLEVKRKRKIQDMLDRY